MCTRNDAGKVYAGSLTQYNLLQRLEECTQTSHLVYLPWYHRNFFAMTISASSLDYPHYYLRRGTQKYLFGNVMGQLFRSVAFLKGGYVEEQPPLMKKAAYSRIYYTCCWIVGREYSRSVPVFGRYFKSFHSSFILIVSCEF